MGLKQNKQSRLPGTGGGKRMDKIIYFLQTGKMRYRCLQSRQADANSWLDSALMSASGTDLTGCYGELCRIRAEPFSPTQTVGGWGRWWAVGN